MSTLTISYDKRHDILYVRDPNAGHSYGEEEADGTIIYRAISDDSLTGMAIFDISQRIKDRSFKLSNLYIPLGDYEQKIQAMIAQ